MGRTRTIGVVVGAIIPAGLYLLFVFHYSVDVPYADDWTIIPLIHSALHGYVSMSGFGVSMETLDYWYRSSSS